MRKVTTRRWAIKLMLSVGLIVILLSVAGLAIAGPEGAITALSATDAPDFGQTITVTASFRADAKINTSNVYYEIIAPDGVTVVATHYTDPPRLDAGETFNDSWTTTNTSFPSSGTYTLRACWSKGGSSNCNIAEATTAFFSVPTMGIWLTLAGAALLGWFLWRRRDDFHRLNPQSAPQSAPQPVATKTTDISP